MSTDLVILNEFWSILIDIWSTMVIDPGCPYVKNPYYIDFWQFLYWFSSPTNHDTKFRHPNFLSNFNHKNVLLDSIVLAWKLPICVLSSTPELENNVHISWLVEGQYLCTNTFKPISIFWSLLLSLVMLRKNQIKCTLDSIVYAWKVPVCVLSSTPELENLNLKTTYIFLGL